MRLHLYYLTACRMVSILVGPDDATDELVSDSMYALSFGLGQQY